MGDLYKASLGQAVEMEQSEPAEPTDPVKNNLPHAGESMETSDGQQVFAKSPEIHIAENQKKHSILFLLESVEKDEDQEDEDSFEEIDLEEFSGVAALGGGPALPLGQKPKYFDDPEKALEEQIERMRILEAYHQKTSNKLK